MSQIQFGQLLGAHFITVSKWERGISPPTPYQMAMLEGFQKTAAQKKTEAQEQALKLLIGAGVVAAVAWLLSAK
jgi:putative transcriptional regulator